MARGMGVQSTLSAEYIGWKQCLDARNAAFTFRKRGESLAGLSQVVSERPAEAGTPALARPAEAGTPTRPAEAGTPA